MMNRYIRSLMQNFGQRDYKNFIGYVYTTLQKEIDAIKNKKDKDKYIKIRKSILEYIVSNERAITSELRRNKIK
jgi:hypothetical protein